jgi:hypothetical protein
MLQFYVREWGPSQGAVSEIGHNGLSRVRDHATVSSMGDWFDETTDIARDDDFWVDRFAAERAEHRRFGRVRAAVQVWIGSTSAAAAVSSSSQSLGSLSGTSTSFENPTST